jgi:hypothetical protein
MYDTFSALFNLHASKWKNPDLELCNVISSPTDVSPNEKFRIFSVPWNASSKDRVDQRLNMELDPQSLQYLGSMSRDVHSCTHWLRLRNPLPRRYGGAIGQLR